MLQAEPAKVLFDGLGLNIAKNLNSIYGEKYVKNPKDSAGGYAGCIRCCGNCCKTSCIVLAWCDCGPTKKISTGNIGLLIEFGRLVKKLPPGLHLINPCSQRLMIVDIRTKVLDIPPQNLLTKDNVTIKVDAFITYRIVCPELAYFSVQDFTSLLMNLCKGLFKTVVAERTLTELLNDRHAISK